MYRNPFIYKRPLQPGLDDLITIRRGNLLAKALSGLEFGHWYSICGGKKIGKTSFLLALFEACRKEERDYRFILIKREELLHSQCQEFYGLLCQRLQGLAGLPAKPLGSAADLGTVKACLKNAGQGLRASGRLILAIDGAESLPKEFLQELFRALLHLQQGQAVGELPANFQFIVSGMLDTIDLQIEPGYSLSEYTMRFFLEDFRYEDVEEMLSRAAAKLRLDCHPGFGRLLYDTTAGTGYLIQKICYRILEAAFLHRERAAFSLQNAEAAITSMLKEGETNVEMLITQIESDQGLVECLMRTLRAGTISSTKFDPQFKTLLALGALTVQNGFYRVRNRIYESAFQEYFTAERMADHYFAQQQYDRARELFSLAANEHMDAQNDLHALLGNIQMIGASLGQGGIIRNILQAYMSVLDNTKNCSFMACDRPEGGALRIIDALGMSHEDMRSFELQMGQGVAGWVAQAGRTRFICDVTDEIECPDFAQREMALRLRFSAMASFPLKANGKVMGVVNLCLAKPRQFSVSEVKMLETLTAYASLALQNTQFHVELEKQQRAADQVRALLQEAGQNPEAEDIFRKIIKTAAEVAATDKAYLVYRKHKAGEWLVLTAGGARVPQSSFPRIEEGQGVAGRVISTGAPYFVAEAQNDPHYFAIWPEVRWELAIPCVVDHEPRGCLSIAGEQAPAMSPVQTQLLAMLAEAVAITLKNKQLYFIAENKTQQVITARSIGEALSHDNSLQEILNLIVSECLNVTGREHKVALVWFKDRERDKLIVKAAEGEAFGRGLIGRARGLRDKSIITEVFKTGLPCLAKDVRRHAMYRATHPEVQSEIAVPLVFRDETIGVIDVQSTRLHDFDDQALEALLAVSHHAAVAAQIGEHYDASKELRSIYRIGARMSSSLKTNEVLKTICAEGLKGLDNGQRSIHVHLVDPETQMPFMYARRSAPSHEDEFCTCGAWHQSRCAEVVHSKTHHLIAEIGQDPRYEASAASIQSAVLVPIVYDNQVNGVITMESRRADDFGETELRFLKGLANQAGVAIANARLGENLAKAQMSVTRALEAAAIEETVAHITHDIKNFSSLIAGETQWLAELEREQQLTSGEIRTATDNINTHVQRIEEFTAQLRSRAYQSPPDLRPCSVREILEEALHLMAARARRQAVEILKNGSSLEVQLHADPQRLVRAFLNLIANALDAMPEGGLLQITAETRNREIQIHFADTGPGIPEENLNRVLQPLFTTKLHGYGLGLVLTKRIIETDHHGKLLLQSRAGAGTLVTVCLPLAEQHSHAGMAPVIPPAGSFRPAQKKGIKTGAILVVNDDAAMLTQIAQLLRRAGHSVMETESGESAVACCRDNRFDVMVLDYHLRKDYSATQTAIDFVPALKKFAPATPIILTSASLDQQLGTPEVFCDFFLEINQSFWSKIIDLVNNCLAAGQNRQQAKPRDRVQP